MSKRTVSTDALESLGTIIGPNEKRDAIHLAVLPVIAKSKLSPGQSIKVSNGVASPSTKGLAIVDPFLANPLKKGDRFWAVLKPRLVTSLRHVWTHPDFPNEEETRPVEFDAQLEISRNWISDFAEQLKMSYEELMEAAERWIFEENYTYDNSEAYKDHFKAFPTFWMHFKVLTGRSPHSEVSFFTCSCS
jgi:hypothetical protein